MKSRTALSGILLCLGMLMWMLTGCGAGKDEVAQEKAEKDAVAFQLERSDWNDDVKAAVNDLLDTYGTGGETPADTPYAVFDFDNTCSIFDIEEQTVVYQLQTMAFAIEPDHMKEIMLTGVPDPKEDLTSYEISGSFDDLAEDIASAYSVLWDRYGPFTAEGVDEKARESLAKDPGWKEFAVKVFKMYDTLDAVCSHDVSYPWITYLFVGMTEDEVYGLTSRALKEYAGKETSEVTWSTSEEIDSKTGPASSVTGVIKAAIDHFGLRALRNSRETVRYGQTEETMFKNKENYAQLELFEEEGLTTKEILDRWCLIKDGESNGLGFATGFLKEYDGYHSHK